MERRQRGGIQLEVARAGVAVPVFKLLTGMLSQFNLKLRAMNKLPPQALWLARP